MMKKLSTATHHIALGLLIALCTITQTHKIGIVEFQTQVEQAHRWPYITFDLSQQTAGYPEYIKAAARIMGMEGTDFLAHCRHLWNQFNPSVLIAQDKPIVPKIIHQIWLGSPLPDEFKEYAESWKKFHNGRGWQYKLWTDADIESLNLYNKDLYDETPNYGIKSDLLRFELLYRYGGVYLDMDFECLQPFDDLNHRYDFYTALQPLDTRIVQLGSAMIGCRPKHPIMAACITQARKRWNQAGVLQRTGPFYFTRIFFSLSGRDGNRDIAFPASYFYPLENLQYDLKYDEWIKGGSYAVHHWSKSWLPVKHRRPGKFKNIKNDDHCKDWNSNSSK